MRQQQKNLKQVKKFELIRVKKYEESFQEFNEDMEVIGKTMRDFVERLTKMKSFLYERSQIEKEYSTKLGQLSTKWIGAGDQNGVEKTEHKDDAGDQNDKRNRQGFFYLVNAASADVSEHLGTFSQLIGDSLCKGDIVQIYNFDV